MSANRARGGGMLVGPFLGLKPTDDGNLRFHVPLGLQGRIVEPAFRKEMSVAPSNVLRAYKADVRDTRLVMELGEGEAEVWGTSLYWITVSFKRGYDYYKHFRLARIHPKAVRIPRLLVKVCSECGETTYGDFCPTCGGRPESVKHSEVWRDREAEERLLGPFTEIMNQGGAVRFIGDRMEYRVPRLALHEYVVSASPSGKIFYLRVLHLPRGSGKGGEGPCRRGAPSAVNPS